MPTGSSRAPLMECDRPSAESMMNRFISAMPSSRCWPFGEYSQAKAEGIFSCLNRSWFSALREQPAPVHPGAEIGRDGDVGRRRDDARGQLAVAARQLVQDQAKALLGRHLAGRLEGELARHLDLGRGQPAAAFLVERRRARGTLRASPHPATGPRTCPIHGRDGCSATRATSPSAPPSSGRRGCPCGPASAGRRP